MYPAVTVASLVVPGCRKAVEKVLYICATSTTTMLLPESSASFWHGVIFIANLSAAFYEATASVLAVVLAVVVALVITVGSGHAMHHGEETPIYTISKLTFRYFSFSLCQCALLFVLLVTR